MGENRWISLAKWYQARTADRRGATRKTMIVARAAAAVPSTSVLVRAVPTLANGLKAVAAPAAFGVTQPSSDLRRQQHDTIITSIIPSRISGRSSSPLDFNP
jgi:hypothetical protein